jgi:PAS domain-containing protein
MTFSGNTRARAEGGDSVSARRQPVTRGRPAAAASRVAYVIADAHGSCLDATDPALELLGTDPDTLRLLRVGDLTKPDTPDSLTQQLIASCDNIGAWLRGVCELLRADGASVRVQFATVRMKSGELAVRFEPLVAEAGARKGPREVLQAWREQELVLAGTQAGSIEHRVAELEALWLAAEYQRLAVARAGSIGNET